MDLFTRADIAAEAELESAQKRERDSLQARWKSRLDPDPAEIRRLVKLIEAGQRAEDQLEALQLAIEAAHEARFAREQLAEIVKGAHDAAGHFNRPAPRGLPTIRPAPDKATEFLAFMQRVHGWMTRR